MEATKQPPPDDEGPRSRPKHRGRRLMRTQSKEETLMAQTAAVKQSKANARAQHREPEEDPDAMHPAHHRARRLVRPHQRREKTHVGDVPFLKA